MPTEHWVAPPEVLDLADEIKNGHPHLEEAAFAIEFVDSKPYVKDRLNLGKVSKFSKAAKLWHNKKYDFCISLCADVWHGILSGEQRKALLDLRFTQCQVEYEPETVEINGKTEKVKDEWGRISYTNVIKRDDEGLPKWQVAPLDLVVFTENVARCGLWLEDLQAFSKAAKKGDV